MNLYTRWIMELLGLDAETALKVQDRMIIDFSECTKRQFNEEARNAHASLNSL